MISFGSPFMNAVIISVAISFFAMITRSQSQDLYVQNVQNVQNVQQQPPESTMAYMIKMFVISFVCVYFGTMFLAAPPSPEINVGEPDF
jgi:type III secretory pathway component EscS